MLSVHVWHLRHALKLDIARLLLQLELALLVAHFVRVLSSCTSGTLATGRIVASAGGDHAELTDVVVV